VNQNIFYDIKIWFHKNFQINPPAVFCPPLQAPEIHLSLILVTILALCILSNLFISSFSKLYIAISFL